MVDKSTKENGDLVAAWDQGIADEWSVPWLVRERDELRAQNERHLDNADQAAKAIEKLRAENEQLRMRQAEAREGSVPRPIQLSLSEGKWRALELVAAHLGKSPDEIISDYVERSVAVNLIIQVHERKSA
jgi:hypothetical protein